ncbi:MAG: hypothetical protein N838_19595 [Thiohalocapsa sp. PB-PSB1]|nr:MAG: hypothetical protein N838_34700 [Thiohalocapsa sp. PB-PSB1]QQO55224.1 MAG: hypothetical protein N838_19595 [Thiohalocapsa sp. PB-PSB1]
MTSWCMPLELIDWLEAQLVLKLAVAQAGSPSWRARTQRAAAIAFGREV